MFQAKRSSDEQSVTSTDTDRSEPRRRYVSARGKENVKQPPHPVCALPDPGNQSSDYYLSDSSSVASDYQYVPRRERDRERDAGRRADLRYSSIPEDAQEINNNSSNKAAMYHSCHDVSLAAQAGGTGRPDWGRQGQGQGHQGQGHPGQGQGPIPSDQMYGSRGGSRLRGGPAHHPRPRGHDGGRGAVAVAGQPVYGADAVAGGAAQGRQHAGPLLLHRPFLLLLLLRPPPAPTPTPAPAQAPAPPLPPPAPYPRAPTAAQRGGRLP